MVSRKLSRRRMRLLRLRKRVSVAYVLDELPQGPDMNSRGGKIQGWQARQAKRYCKDRMEKVVKQTPRPSLYPLVVSNRLRILHADLQGHGSRQSDNSVQILHRLSYRDRGDCRRRLAEYPQRRLYVHLPEGKAGIYLENYFIGGWEWLRHTC